MVLLLLIWFFFFVVLKLYSRSEKNPKELSKHWKKNANLRVMKLRYFFGSGENSKRSSSSSSNSSGSCAEIIDCSIIKINLPIIIPPLKYVYKRPSNLRSLVLNANEWRLYTSILVVCSHHTHVLSILPLTLIATLSILSKCTRTLCP